MPIEFEPSLQVVSPVRREVPVPQPRPATFDLISLVSHSVPNIDERRILFEQAMQSATSCSDLDRALVERIGARSVLELKAATASQLEVPEVVCSFPEPVRRNAVRWANRSLDELQAKAEEEAREERRVMAPVSKEAHLLAQTPWSNRRDSGLPRGVGRYSGDERPSRAKRHNGRNLRS